MINKVLLEHETPFFDDIEQGTLHGTSVHPHPTMEHTHRIQTPHLLVDLLIATTKQDSDKQNKPKYLKYFYVGGVLKKEKTDV